MSELGFVETHQIVEQAGLDLLVGLMESIFHLRSFQGREDSLRYRVGRQASALR